MSEGNTESKIGVFLEISDKVARVKMAEGPLTMGADMVTAEVVATAARSSAQYEGFLVGVDGGITALVESRSSLIWNWMSVFGQETMTS